MNSSASNFRKECGSTPNLPQTGSQFLKCVKTYPSCSIPPHLLSIRNTSEKENKKSRKRKADTFSDDGTKERKRKNDTESPELEPDDSDDSVETSDSDDVQSSDHVGHICGVISNKLLFNRKTEKIQNMKYVIPDLTNVDLPPCYMKSVLENKIISCNVKYYEWEKLVKHEFVNKIDNNMKRTVDSILLPEEECERFRNEVIADFYDVFSEEKLNKPWYCCDSYLQGIVYRNTCIDVYYEAPPFGYVQEAHEELCKKLKTSSCFHKPSKRKGIPELGKPCIEIPHKKTKKQINISFSNLLKVECSRLMKFYLSMNSNLKYLTVYLELILKKYRIKKKRAGVLPPYSTFWLAVFFMQQKNLLPAVIDVRKAARIKHHVSGWDCSLPEDYSCPMVSVSLYSLLLGFFDFYKDFDFLNYVICPYLGHVITLSDIENLKLCDDEWSTYLRQIQSNDQIPFTRSFLNLQDPTDLSWNLNDDVFQCFDLNMFIAICHRLSNTLPKHMTEFDKIDCVCQILLDSMDQANYRPRDFAKYEMFFISRSDVNEGCREKLNQCNLLEAIRKLMEFIFKLELTSVAVSQNFTRARFSKRGRVVRRSFPVMHLEYSSSENTWQSDYMNEIIPEKGPVRIYLRCEVDLIMQHRVHIYAQGEARFVGFLRSNFINMLAYVLNQIISP